MLKVILIRHGATNGNLHHRYIGKTDEPLCEQGIKELTTRVAKGHYPPADIIYVSPMLRCQQTAAILYPNQKKEIIHELRECDFGTFEGKNHQELTGNIEYQAWVDSNAVLPFPQGESKESFSLRCVNAMEELLEKHKDQNITMAVVVHGGVIMAVLEHFAKEKREFYEWHSENGQGFCCSLTKEMELTQIETL